MIPEKKKPDFWREALKFINRCPVCGSVYNTKNARLFASQDSANMIHISCAKCAGNFIAMVVQVGHSLSSMGIVSDLNFSDAEKFCQSEPIKMDEMIEAIRQIKNNNLIIQK